MSGRNIKWAERILSKLIDEKWLEDVLGDLEEHLYDIRELPPLRRTINFWFHVTCCVRPSLLRSFQPPFISNTISMLRFNTKLAIRNAARHPALTAASIMTLILGALCFQFIFAWLANEQRMNRMHKHFDELYITAVKTNPSADLTSISLQTMFQMDYSQFPEVISTAQVHVYQKDDIKLSTSQHDFKGRAMIVDSTFLDLFDFTILAGAEKPLYDPSSIVITESLAERMFGEESAIGKTVQLTCDQQGSYQVAAIVKDIPTHSSITFDFLVPRHSQRFWRRIPQEIVLTKAGLDIQEFNNKIRKLGRENNTRFPESELYLIPLAKCYENSILEASFFSKYGNKDNKIILAFIGLMIWLITMFGFNNLQLTQQLAMSKNLSIQQIIGGSTGTINKELLISKAIFLLSGLGLSFLIYQGVFPIAKQYLEVEIDAAPLLDFTSLSAFLFATVGLSVITGYIHLYKLKPGKAMNASESQMKVPIQQKVLTTFQYVITTVLIIATCVVYLQFDFMLSKDTGMHYTNVYGIDFFELVPNSSEQTSKDFQHIQNTLRSNPSIAFFSQGDLPISQKVNPTSWKRTDSDYEYTTENMMAVTPDYQNLLGLEIIKGRFFNDSLDQSNQQKVVINEAAMDYWGIDDLDQISLSSNTSGRQENQFNIIGVIKDYHYQHLSHKIKPLVLRYRAYRDDPFLIRFKEGQEKAGLTFLEKLYTEINPAGTFTYDSLQNKLEAQYLEEKKLAKIYFIFTVIALLLSSLCLFTFAYYETRRRTKEIGVRKVIGASNKELFALLSKSFGKTILIAFAIALPLAYFFQDKWMNQFENRATIGWWVYVATALLILFAALIATGFHTLKVARQNPVDSLRYE